MSVRSRLARPLARLERAAPSPAATVSIVVVVLAWQALSLAFAPRQFPGLGRLAGEVVTVLAGAGRFDPVPTYGATLLRVGIGFAAALTLATVWGILAGIRSRLGAVLAGPLVVLLTVPSVVWAFLGVLWFGLADLLVPVFVVVLVVFPYLAVSLQSATAAFDPHLDAMARTVGAGRRLRWRDIYLPQLRAPLFGAARIGLALAWKLTLVAEVFGAGTGVGVAVQYHFQAFDSGPVIAWALPVMATIFAVDRGLARLTADTAQTDTTVGAIE